tara:strand:- start:5519 stop:6661 length:1143 start_codon:yes stop_codon:yes gene_type:complete
MSKNIEEHFVKFNIPWGFSETVFLYDSANFQDFLNLSESELKDICTGPGGRLKHIIKSGHFNIEFLSTICETAYAAKRIDRLEDNFLKSLLQHQSVLNYFQQASTRTLNSFSGAQARLGMMRKNVTEIATTSTVKGESEKDSLRTQSSYYDVIVCRYNSDVYDEFAVWALSNCDREIPFINGGSGTKEHPTQAILDYYTSWRAFNGKMDNKVHVMCGDPRNSRTIKSRSKLYALHKNQTFIYVADHDHQIDEETEAYVRDLGVKVEKVVNLRDVVEIADEINMTRKQTEYMTGSKPVLYPDRLIFKASYLDLMKDSAILTHPLPKRNEIDPAVDYMKKNPKVMLWRALRDGMWARVGLHAYLSGVDSQIMQHYERIKSAI